MPIPNEASFDDIFNSHKSPYFLENSEFEFSALIHYTQIIYCFEDRL